MRGGPLVLLIGLLAGCSAPISGAPVAVPAVANPLPSDGAPKVDRTVDPGRFLTNPCAMFTDAQRKTVGFGDGKPSTPENGAVCEWDGSAGGFAKVQFLTTNVRGLSAPYANRNAGGFAYFEPTLIHGQPGIFANPLDQRSMGECVVLIGLDDKLLLWLSVHQSPAKVGTKSPCDVAATVVGLALDTMLAG